MLRPGVVGRPPGNELALQKLLRALGPVSIEAVKASLAEPPYALHVKHTAMVSVDGATVDHLVLFKYDQIKTKFAEAGRAAVEARGIILRYPSWEVACYPFDKFFNLGEGCADELDWASAVVAEKLDGSLIKVWYNAVVRRWVVSTNGTIDADKALCGDGDGTGRCWRDLFNDAARTSGFDFGRLDRNLAYFFELCHPATTVVIAHPRPRLVHLGARDSVTFREVPDADVGVERPQLFPLGSGQACAAAALALGPESEGYVAMSVTPDGTVKRVKIKSPTYVAMHHLKGRAIPKAQACATVLLTNEVDELRAYYRTDPTIKDYADDIDVLAGQLAAAVAALAVALAPAVAGAPADDADAGKGGLKKYYALAIRAALDGAPSSLSKPAFGVAMKALDDHRSEPLSPAMLDTLIRAKYVTMKGEKVASVRAKEFVAFVTNSYWAGEE